MAKPIQTPATTNAPIPAPAGGHLGVLTYKAGDHTYTADAAALPAATLKRLIENGFTQMLSDCGALSKEQKTKLLAKLRKEGKTGADDELIAARDHEKREAKLRAMREGTLGDARGPQADPVTKIMRDIAEARVKAAAAAKKIDLTDAQVESNVKAYMVKAEADLRGLAEAQIAAKKAAEGIEIEL